VFFAAKILLTMHISMDEIPTGFFYAPAKNWQADEKMRIV